MNVNRHVDHRLKRRGREQMVDSPWSAPSSTPAAPSKGSNELDPATNPETTISEPASDIIQMLQDSLSPQEEGTVLSQDSQENTEHAEIEVPIMHESAQGEEFIEQSNYEPAKHHHDDEEDEEDEQEKKERKKRKKRLKKKERENELDRKKREQGNVPPPSMATQTSGAIDPPPTPTQTEAILPSSSSFSAVFTVVTKTTGTTTIYMGENNNNNDSNNGSNYSPSKSRQDDSDMRIGMGMAPPIGQSNGNDGSTSDASTLHVSPLLVTSLFLLFFFFRGHAR